MLYTNDLPATGMKWGYVYGEVIEFLEEVAKHDVQGMISEACDVYTCTSCALLTTTGINLPIVWTRSADGWFHRVDVFRKMLNDKGLKFKLEYLRYGSNYKKPEKVAKVIELATLDQR